MIVETKITTSANYVANSFFLQALGSTVSSERIVDDGDEYSRIEEDHDDFILFLYFTELLKQSFSENLDDEEYESVNKYLNALTSIYQTKLFKEISDFISSGSLPLGEQTLVELVGLTDRANDIDRSPHANSFKVIESLFVKEQCPQVLIYTLNNLKDNIWLTEFEKQSGNDYLILDRDYIAQLSDSLLAQIEVNQKGMVSYDSRQMLESGDTLTYDIDGVKVPTTAQNSEKKISDIFELLDSQKIKIPENYLKIILLATNINALSVTNNTVLRDQLREQNIAIDVFLDQWPNEEIEILEGFEINKQTIKAFTQDRSVLYKNIIKHFELNIDEQDRMHNTSFIRNLKEEFDRIQSIFNQQYQTELKYKDIVPNVITKIMYAIILINRALAQLDEENEAQVYPLP